MKWIIALFVVFVSLCFSETIQTTEAGCHGGGILGRQRRVERRMNRREARAEARWYGYSVYAGYSY